MPLPLIVLLSSDADLATRLNEPLSSRFRVIVCDTLKHAVGVFDDASVWGCVADFRQILGGGHAEERFLEIVRHRSPDLELVVLTSLRCPEPIERHCACNPGARFADPLAVDTITEHLEQRAPVSASPSPPVIPDTFPALQKTESDVVVHGLTRRFETSTPRIKLMLSDLEVAAKHDVTLLMIGETGAGKTYLARLIHEISPRRNEPFLPVACGALPADLIESELFGHNRGAFTSAHADKEGKFLAAGCGTILLDEIDVLGLEQQVKLLRVIESGEFEPVGSNRTYRSQARLVVASNLDLQPLVQQGRFRPDLYYRLNMLKFEIPPLRTRKPDIVPLAEKFVTELSAKHGITIRSIDHGFWNALYDYPWPGNVRELENVVQRAVIYCRDGALTAQQLPTYILTGTVGPTNDPSVNLDHWEGPPQVTSGSLGKQIAFTERDLIEQALSKHNYSRTSTAKALGISRVTLYNKMKKYGMGK
jgi:DNA-binding NtrC family response regulator